MCYDDGTLGSVVPALTMQIICSLTHGNRFDCNHDDYFYAGTPSPGNYLATHWNTANSSFLSASAPELPAASLANGRFTPLDPTRILNTRNGIGAPAVPIGAGGSIDLPVTGVAGVPATGVGAVVLNVTATQPTANSWLTSYPTGGALPNTAALTYVPGQTVSNLVVAKVGSGGKVSLRNASGSVHLIVEILGWTSA